MKDNIVRKGLVLGIIILFVGAGVIPSMGGTIVEKQSPKDDKSSFIGFNPRGDILYVGGSGPGNYTSIQDAIDNASDGDTVFVYDDSSPYYEQFGVRVIDKSINLVGENRDTTIIELIEQEGDYVVYVERGWINISGFTFQGGNEGRGIYLYESSSNIVSGNIIIGKSGINLHRSDSNTISDNVIQSTNLEYGEYGLVLSEDSSHNIITDNVFFNSGLSIWSSDDGLIYNNTVSNNTVNGKPLVYYEEESDIIIDDAGQVILIKCDNITVQNQEFSNVGDAIILSETDNCLISGNTISHCKDGINLDYSSNNNISWNIISDYHMGIFLYYDCNENIISYNSLTNSDDSGIKIFHQSNFNNMYMNIIDNSENNRAGAGFDVHLSDNNNFSRNTIINFYIAFHFQNSYNNTIFMNDIINCIYGFFMYDPPMDNTALQINQKNNMNKVLNNNFKRVVLKGFSIFISSLSTIWDGNYWGRPRVLPKLIIGFKMVSGIPVPSQLEFDRHPALKPYDIPKIAI